MDVRERFSNVSRMPSRRTLCMDNVQGRLALVEKFVHQPQPGCATFVLTSHSRMMAGLLKLPLPSAALSKRPIRPS